MKSLLEVTKIGNIELRNRFVRSGTWMRKATEDGELTPELFAEYRKLAQANLGMVVVGYSRVNQYEKANNRMIGMYDDKFIPELQKFTEMFHQNGTPVGIQIAMGGTQVHYQGDINWELMSPSATVVKRKDASGSELEIKVPEMTGKQIEIVINDFVAAARRVKQAGFDLIQLHAGHGYFLSQWLNLEKNLRTDEYGVDRTKFIVDLYRAVRAEVGPDFPIAIKLNSEERIGDDSNHQLILELATKLDQLGIDMIEVSGFAPSRNKISLENESYFSEFAGKLSAVVSCPVMLTGGNKTFTNIEQVLNAKDIDLVGISRPLISEPNLIKEWMNNQEYKTRCISCNHCHRKVYQCVFDK